MTSVCQIESNRQNALLSTGPRTVEGKAIAAQNSLKHGLFSKQVLMKWEQAGDLTKLQEAIVESLLPTPGLEEALVDRIVSILWRLKRLSQLEGDFLEPDPLETSGWMMTGEGDRRTGTSLFQNDRCAEGLSRLTHYEMALERTLYRSLHELQRLQAMRQGYSKPPGIVDVNVFR